MVQAKKSYLFCIPYFPKKKSLLPMTADWLQMTYGRVWESNGAFGLKRVMWYLVPSNVL